MIYDEVLNAKMYARVCAQLNAAIKFIRRVSPQVKDGRYDIGGDGMYVSVSTYYTKADLKLPFEAHKKYIDVQCLLRGTERIDIAQGRGFRVKERYSTKKDILFVYPPEDYSSLVLVPGKFAFIYPHDFHRPGQAAGKPSEVRKVVVKIPVT